MNTQQAMAWMQVIGGAVLLFQQLIAMFHGQHPDTQSVAAGGALTTGGVAHLLPRPPGNNK